MTKFMLEYWRDNLLYVGRLRGVAGVFSQGMTVDELEDNIRGAYRLIQETEPAPTRSPVLTREVEI